MVREKYTGLLESLISGSVYQVRRGPEALFERNNSSFEGNCQLLLRRYYYENGILLPKQMRSSEVFLNVYESASGLPESWRLLHEKMTRDGISPGIFTSVPPGAPLFAGDIFLWGNTAGSLDPRKLHIAVFSGEVNEVGDPLLLHANKLTSSVVLWPISRFTAFERKTPDGTLKPNYRNLYGIRRLAEGALHERLLQGVPAHPVWWEIPGEIAYSDADFQNLSAEYLSKLQMTHGQFIEKLRRELEEEYCTPY